MGLIHHVFKPADRFLVAAMKIIIILVTIMATGTMFLQVVARYIFEISISGLDELTGHTAVWLYLMGAAFGTYDRSQIKADMVHLFIKNKTVLAVIRAMAALVSVIVACFMTVWSYGYVHWSILKHEVTPSLQLPTVIFQISILIGAILMVIYFIVELVDEIKQISLPRAGQSPQSGSIAQ